MNAITSPRSESLINRHRLPVFVGLAYLLSWYPWAIAIAQGRATGPNPLGPFVAAIIVAASCGGRAEVKALLARVVRARVGWRWYAFVFGVPAAVCLAAAAVTSVVVGSGVALPAFASVRELPERFIFIFLFVALGEEPGWRGFALPELQKTHSPLVASLMLAPIWAIWHLPLFGHEFPLPIVPPFLLGLLGATFVHTWLFNRTGGSVLLQMIIHASVNTVGPALIFPLFNGTGLLMLWWVNGALWLATGIFLLTTGSRRRA